MKYMNVGYASRGAGSVGVGGVSGMICGVTTAVSVIISYRKPGEVVVIGVTAVKNNESRLRPLNVKKGVVVGDAGGVMPMSKGTPSSERRGGSKRPICTRVQKR